MTAAGAQAVLRAIHGQVERLVAERRVDEAVELYDRVLAVRPDDPEVLVAKGSVLLLGDDTPRAQRHFEALTRLHPRMEDAWHGLGKALHDQHLCDQAIAVFTHAATLTATPGRALYHRGMSYLLAGRFAEGWRDYEHRFAVPQLNPRRFSHPRWDGQALGGRRLLVICEQGYGDVFQFARFLPQLRGLGGTVVFECPMELHALLAPLLDGFEVVPLRGRGPPDVPFDCYTALMSLPFHLGIDLQDLDPTPGYLGIRHAPPPLRETLRIGVCWAGSPNHPEDLHRSMMPEWLAPLAADPRVHLVSLQKTAPRWAPLPGLSGFLHDPPAPLTDFTTTARLIASLDAVVTVDTAIAHLAGAIGCPVWLLLSRASEWRWLIGRSDSPWYATTHLTRQHTLGDWRGPVEQVRNDIARIGR